MMGPEYFTVAAYIPADSGGILCRECGDKAGLPVSDQIMQSSFNGGDWNEGCYCDYCEAEIVAPYEWTCPYCGREYYGEDAANLESEYYASRSTFKCLDEPDGCPGENESE